MKMMLRFQRVLSSLAALAGLAAAVNAPAQVARRLSVVPAATAARVPLDGTLSGRPATSSVLGHLSGDVQLQGMSLMLAPTAAQDAALTQLLADQQNPASPSYHQWLTPAQFGERFGVADADVAVLESWLQGNGFSVDEVAPSRNRIVFSGTAAAVENAFGTTMQRYSRDAQTFFENSTRLQIPAAFSGVIGGVSGISSYRLPPPVKHLQGDATKATPLYTSSKGNHYLVPWDVRQIFGSNTLISSGYDGTGIKIAVLGQSAVSTTQLTFFQQKTGQTVKLPTMVLVPNTGTSTTYTGDEGESELDLEYAGGHAPGATVLFIYSGSNNTSGVFDAMAYAVTNNLAPILTLSYGTCESQSVAASINSTLEPVLRQANAQGQTFIASSGDTGATSCETASTPTLATGGLSVSYPASSTYATGVGGTQLTSDASTYWSSSNNSYAGSAIGYIPEVAWNDTVLYGSFSQSGGGASVIFGKPSWQMGTGVPADGHRDVPDISLPANVEEFGYIICTADGSSACTDSTVGFVTGGGSLVGGTSAAAPNFAGMLAIIEQANGGAALGNVNPGLYTLAAGSSGTSVFHDITSGNNIVACKGGTTGCSSTVATTNGTMGYTAGIGYDQVTGLGSVAAPALQTGLKALATTATLQTSSVSLVASVQSPTINTSVTFTAVVSGTGATPTGTVTFAVDGTTVGSAVTLSSGTATYTSSGFTTAGAHTVVATYSGSSVYTTSAATLAITAVGTTTTGTAGITLSTSPATLTVTAGSSGAETLMVTSTNSYTGSVGFTAALTSSTGTFSGCYTLSPSTVSPAANATATATITIYTSTANCTTTGSVSLKSSKSVLTSHRDAGSQPFGKTGWVIASAGLLGCCLLRRRFRMGSLLALAGFVAVLGLGGCGSGGTSSTSTTTTSTKGTYVIQLTATSAASSSVSATSSFSLVVQ